MSETITAIATASGVSSISIIRLSGTDAKKIAGYVAPKATFRPRYSDLTSLYNHSGEMIDHALVVYFQNPQSFTGEDIVEFQCHGGIVVAQEILADLSWCEIGRARRVQQAGISQWQDRLERSRGHRQAH